MASHHIFKKPFDSYKETHEKSLDATFYDKQDLIEFDGPFKCKKSIANFTFEIDGYINASYNCIDRHDPNKPAIFWETDEPNPDVSLNTMTFGQLLQLTSQLANTLLAMGINKGDRVGICTGQTPYAVIAMLACARIGCIHVVIFAGFSTEAVRDRLRDSACRVVICADVGMRGSKVIPILQTVVNALPATVEHVIVAIRPSSISDLLSIHNDPAYNKSDLIKRKQHVQHLMTDKCSYWDDLVVQHRPYCPPARVHAEDPLFILHTSGSTGKPKGLLHATGGYLLGAAMSCKYIFNLETNHVFGCMADCGWITGHSYICYGPLSLGCCTVIFEPTPVYPNPHRYVDTVIKWGINAFYTAPTAIRLLRKLHFMDPVDSDGLNNGNSPSIVGSVANTNCKVLGSVGEPINPEAWHYYNNEFGGNQCAIVDTYWQTETGSIIISALPFVTLTKPGSATFDFFGIKSELLDPDTLEVITGNDAEGLLAIKEPWPSMARTIWRDHQRFIKTYIKNNKYITGDTGFRDGDGYMWIRGRVDDVVNVAGHRLSTAEVESALAQHPDCSESASIGIPDEMSGQAVSAY